MPSPQPNGKIVQFPSSVASAAVRENDTCVVCKLPKFTGTLCRVCAFGLVDVALSSNSTDFRLLAAAPTSNASPPVEVEFNYDYYEVCRQSSGQPHELGRGSMGITYKAIDTRLGCPVALKIINSERLGGPAARDRFLQEARTAAKLRHANIASVFHLGHETENCFYAMEFVDGETLDERIRREGAMPYGVALDVLTQCARGLRAAHAQRFIHRDIKPTNIMLVTGEYPADDHDWVKLIDFGLVTAEADGPDGETFSRGYFAGTPHFASPEQLESGQVDVRSDIYSLGKCFEYMLTGHLLGPTSSTTAEIADAIESPPAVCALLQSMIAKIPSQRLQSASELLEAIRVCDAAIQPRPSHLPGEAKSSIKKTLVWCVALVAVFTCCMFAFRFGSGSRTKSDAARSSPSASTVETQVLLAEGCDRLRKLTKADNERALDLFTRALRIAPELADAEAGLAMGYLENVCRFGQPREQLERAANHAQRAITLAPDSARGYAALGAIRGYEGRHWEALVQVHRALELDPRDPEAMRAFSLLWSTVGQPQYGLPWAIGATRIEPTNLGLWSAACEACTDLADDDRALGFYQHCLEVNPVWIPGYLGQMHIHLLRGDYERAREDYERTQSIDPDLILALTLKGQLDLFSGDYFTAEKTYRQLLEKDRHGAANYFGGISYLSALGYLRLRAGDQTEADSFLEEAARLHTKTEGGPQGVYDLAAIRAVQGRTTDALLLLRQAVRAGWVDYRVTKLDPRFEKVRDAPEFDTLLNNLASRVASMREQANVLCEKPLNIADYPVKPPNP